MTEETVTQETSIRPSQRPTSQLVAPRRVSNAAGDAVLVATRDRGSLQVLATRLIGRVTVEPIASMNQLLARLRDPRGVIGMVVVDACAPSIDLGILARELDERRSVRAVVVWGSTDQLRSSLSESAATREWIHLSSDTTPQEIATIISSMV